MTRLAAVAIVLGCALLTVARIPVFRSDAALWWSAYPSAAPRVAVNIASGLIVEQDFERALVYTMRALELAERPESAYERDAVREIVTNQIRYIDAFYPVCDRPSLRPFCS